MVNMHSQKQLLERMEKMKKTLKNLIVLSLVCVMALSFASCGDKETSTDGVEKITMWSDNTHSKAVFEELVKKFNETTGKEKGIELVYEVKEGEGKDLDLAIKSGNAPDLFQKCNKDIAYDGQIVAINDIEGGTEFLKKYNPKYLKTYTYDGKTYSVPFSSSARGLIINNDMFKAAGIVDENGNAKAPETWDEFVAVAKKLTNPEKNQYGIVFPMKWGTWVASDITSPAFSSIGYESYNPATGKYDFTSYKPMLEVIMQIKKDGSYLPGAEGLDNDPARARFAEGNIGMKFGFSWDVGVFNDQFPAKMDWSVVPYPVFDKDNKYSQIISVNGGMAINKKSKKDINKIFEVYKWYHSPEVMTELYGNCMELPVSSDFLLDDTLKVEKKGWADFCDLIDISTTREQAMPYEASNLESFPNAVINKIWYESESIDEVLKYYTDAYNKGVDKYFELHPDEKREDYIIPDYDVKR